MAAISSFKAQVNPSLVDIPHEVFVNDGKTNFKNILFQDETIEQKVKTLHSYNELTHDLAIRTNNFDEYWKRYKNQWYLIKFNADQTPLLLFKGIKNTGDEREYIEIYDVDKKRNQRALYSAVGQLLAYKIHPLTNEVVLYSHKYPCCKSASHNIYRIRRLEDGLKINDRFFVGRDSGDMVGPFFPNKANFSEEYSKLSERTELRWSPAIVNDNAFEERAETNMIINYNEGALYKLLYEKDNWQFVVLFNGIAEEQSKVLNYTNFKNKGVYGWMKVMNNN
jgi:uncharacterized protein YozE (UPF0346 family)